jgi:cytochrome b involved in lipid metabolism
MGCGGSQLTQSSNNAGGSAALVGKDVVYTLEQVATHDNEDSLWLVIDGVVLDVTDFQYFHPGMLVHE